MAFEDEQPGGILRSSTADGVAGKSALAGLGVLTACMLVVFVATTLTVTKAAPIEESEAARRIHAIHPHLMRLGALAGVLVCVVSIGVSAGRLARRDFAWSALFLLAGVAAGVASHALVRGAWIGTGVEDLPVADYEGGFNRRGQLSCAALVVACAVWVFRYRRGQRRRIADGEWRDAEGAIADCIRRVTWKQFLASLPGVLLSAGIAGLVIGVPVAWSALERAKDFGGGSFDAVVLSGSGIAMFCVLLCLLLSGMLAVVIALVRSGGIAGRVSLTIGLVAGMFASLFCFWGLLQSFGDEIRALGMTVLIGSMLLVGGLFFSLAFSRSLLEMCRDPHRPRNLGDLVRISILAGVLFWILPIVRWLRGHVRPGRAMIFAGAATIGLAIAHLTPTLFPKMEDFSDRIQFMVVALVLLLTALLSSVVAPPAGRRWKMSLGVLVAMMAGVAATIGLAIAYLIPTLFPNVEDFSNRIQFLVIALVLLLTALLNFAVIPSAGRRWKMSLGVLVAMMAGAAFVVLDSHDSRAQARLRVFQYDPLGKCSLRIVERVLPNRRETFGGGDDPTEAERFRASAIGCSPTRRVAVMDKLSRERPLIILIIWDAARGDHMSIFGYRRTRAPFLTTTPNLDRHKGEFLRFTNAFSQATATSCSMRHLFTGRYSSRWMRKRKGIAPFWTNKLARAGYHTFHMNIIGSDYNGISLEAFHRDMPSDLKDRLDTLRCPSCPKNAGTGSRKHYTHKAVAGRASKPKGRIRMIECTRQNERKAIGDLLALLETQKDTGGSGVFAYIHMDATHTPWGRFEDVEDFGDSQKDRYDQTIRYSDFATGELIEGLKKLGMWDRTILIVTADHGTGLNDHGKYGGYHPWLELINIPIVMKIPGVKGREVHDLVGLFDLGPTFGDVFFPGKLRQYESRSLWPIILDQQKWNDRVLFGLNSFSDCYFLVRADGWHYVRHRRQRYEQLYNLRTDPSERDNRIEADRQATARARAEMEWFLYSHGSKRSYTNPYHYRKGPLSR